MSLSPLLKFALESFEHASEQYMLGTEKSRRFSVLHCDQAIELILKEKLRSLKESIFEKNGRTIDFHDALNKLISNKGITIPEATDLELIHDQRNIIQHKGATVSREEAEFYIKTGYEFIKRFLKAELGLDLKKILDKRYYEALEPREEVMGYEIIEVKEHMKADPLSLVLVEYRNIEVELIKLARKMGYASNRRIDEPFKTLAKAGQLPLRMYRDYLLIRQMRNSFAHTEKTPTETELEIFMIKAVELKNKLKEMNEQ